MLERESRDTLPFFIYIDKGKVAFFYALLLGVVKWRKINEPRLDFKGLTKGLRIFSQYKIKEGGEILMWKIKMFMYDKVQEIKEALNAKAELYGKAYSPRAYTLREQRVEILTNAGR